MAEVTKDDRILTLRLVSKQRKQEAFDRAERAIRSVLLNGERLSFASVAREARLSVAYLYKYPDLRRRIQLLRSQQEEQGRNKVKLPPASAKSQQSVIQHLKTRIKELQIERDAQKKQIAALTGQVYELNSDKWHFERIRDENGRLSKQLAELKQLHRERGDPPLSAMREISADVKAQLAKLDIRLSLSLSQRIVTYAELRVLNAIAVVREAASAGQVRSKIRLFIKALDQGWEPGEDVVAKREALEFSRWFDSAKAKGLVIASRGTPNGIIVLTAEQKWVSYLEMRNDSRPAARCRPVDGAEPQQARDLDSHSPITHSANTP